MTYSTTTQAFLFPTCTNNYLYPWFLPKTTPSPLDQVHKQYCPFFLPFKASIRLLPAGINTQCISIWFLPCIACITLLLATKAAEGKPFRLHPLVPLLSHSSSSHSPSEASIFEQDLHNNPFHQHPQDSNSPFRRAKEIVFNTKNICKYIFLHTHIHVYAVWLPSTDWIAVENSHKTIKLSSGVADGGKLFSLSQLNYCITASLKAMRY